MNVALQNRKVTASGIAMRTRLLAFLVAFAVLWCGTGGPALACSADGAASIVVAIDAIDQANPDDSERRSKPSGQAVAHHHCCTATYTAEAPFEALPSLKEAPVTPANSATMTSFAQAPPVQPPAA